MARNWWDHVVETFMQERSIVARVLSLFIFEVSKRLIHLNFAPIISIGKTVNSLELTNRFDL